MDRVRIGLAGFGRMGRQIYRLALADERCEVVAVAEAGQPELLHRVLAREMGRGADVALEGGYLVGGGGAAPQRARLLATSLPAEVPWDLLGVDVVVEASLTRRGRGEVDAHLGNGAGRVLLATPPVNGADRVVLYGVNQDRAVAADRIVSAGSPAGAAAGLAMRVISAALPVDYATMTSVDAYGSDERTRDGADYRHSRPGAENVVPMASVASAWVEMALPALRGKMGGFALNVPVAAGSLLDLTVSLGDAGVDAGAVNELFVVAAAAEPELIAVTDDPIVSSDVKGRSQSLLVDLQGTMRAGDRLLKVLAWHETLGHARSVLDLAALYAELDRAQPGRAAN